MTVNMTSSAQSNAAEIMNLYAHVLPIAKAWLENADADQQEDGEEALCKPRPAIVDMKSPQDLATTLELDFPSSGDKACLPSLVDSLFAHSVNTSSPGFMDKLYSSPSPPGLAADLMLSILNTNAHVYTVSPALTLVEKYTARRLAAKFGLSSDYSGGVTVPGGAMANFTAMLVARNIMFPSVPMDGMASLTRPLAVFTSVASHYSILSSAQSLGLGRKSVFKVATTSDEAMDPAALQDAITRAVEAGFQPFYISATAGTTVRGAYDPLVALSEIAKRHGMWLHVDACWGGGAVFSPRYAYKLDGSDHADSIAFNPHKMLGVPLTCSFLLVKDMRHLYVANKLEAGYLFHGDDGLGSLDATPREEIKGPKAWRHATAIAQSPHPSQIYDLAQLTTQCGRRPDALKLYTHWRYYGDSGMAAHVETAFDGAQRVAELVTASPLLRSVDQVDQPESATATSTTTTTTPPCAQVCFYYSGRDRSRPLGPLKSMTREITRRLVAHGWMTDYAPGRDGNEEYLRVVCNRLTTSQVASRLIRDIEMVGQEVEMGHES